MTQVVWGEGMSIMGDSGSVGEGTCVGEVVGSMGEEISSVGE